MKDDDLQTIYNKVFQEALILTMNHDPQKIAATYMAIACRISSAVWARLSTRRVCPCELR